MIDDYELTLKVNVDYDLQQSTGRDADGCGESHIQNLSVMLLDDKGVATLDLTPYLSAEQLAEIHCDVEESVPEDWAELERADEEIDRMKEES